MNRDDVVHMAREAGASPDGRLWLMYAEDLERFAALVAAAEREACAEVCDAAHELMNSSFQGAAAAIRARGQE